VAKELMSTPDFKAHFDSNTSKAPYGVSRDLYWNIAQKMGGQATEHEIQGKFRGPWSLGPPTKVQQPRMKALTI